MLSNIVHIGFEMKRTCLVATLKLILCKARLFDYIFLGKLKKKILGPILSISESGKGTYISPSPLPCSLAVSLVHLRYSCLIYKEQCSTYEGGDFESNIDSFRMKLVVYIACH